MDPFLAIETATPLGGVALGRGDALLGEISVGVRARHAESLMPAVDFVLRAARLEVGALAGVVVGGGPGSFTGVRIGAAAAKGLVHALGIPLFAYSGLHAVAGAAGCGARPVCALFDARRGEVYAACYRFPDFARSETVMPPKVAPVEEVVAEVAEHAPVYAGEGALRYRDAIEAAGGVVAPVHLAVPRAAALLWLADLDPEAGRVASPADWEPEYLRGAGAERGVRG